MVIKANNSLEDELLRQKSDVPSMKFPDISAIQSESEVSFVAEHKFE